MRAGETVLSHRTSLKHLHASLCHVLLFTFKKRPVMKAVLTPDWPLLMKLITISVIPVRIANKKNKQNKWNWGEATTATQNCRTEANNLDKGSKGAHSWQIMSRGECSYNNSSGLVRLEMLWTVNQTMSVLSYPHGINNHWKRIYLQKGISKSSAKKILLSLLGLGNVYWMFLSLNKCMRNNFITLFRFHSNILFIFYSYYYLIRQIRIITSRACQ